MELVSYSFDVKVAACSTFEHSHDVSNQPELFLVAFFTSETQGGSLKLDEASLHFTSSIGVKKGLRLLLHSPVFVLGALSKKNQFPH